MKRPIMRADLGDPKTVIVCTVMPVRQFDEEVNKLRDKLKKQEISRQELDSKVAELEDRLEDEPELKRIHINGTKKRIMELVKAGMKIARINFSHVREDIERSNTEELMKIIRQVSQEIYGSHRRKVGKPVGIMMDLCGPRARIGHLEHPVRVEDEFTLTTCEEPEEGEIPVNKDTYIRFDQDIKENERLLIDDGRIKATIRKIDPCDKGAKGAKILCKAEVGGLIESNKGICVPDSEFQGAVITQKDTDDLRNFLPLKDGKGYYLIDYVAQSFVRKPSDYNLVNELISAYRGERIPIIAKIETKEAVEDNIDEIARKYDCLMVARGDLGVNTSFDKVPKYQRNIINAAHKYNKPVIVATQMLEAMFYLHRHEPLRPEVTDIAVAVEEADGIMTSVETIRSENPGEIVKTMATIAHTVEKGRRMIEAKFPEGLDEYDERYYSIAHAACRLAESRDSPAIVVSTYAGRGARAISYFRPQQSIIAITTERKTAIELLLYSNVYPILIERPKELSTEEYIDMIIEILKYLGLGKNGKEIVAVFGVQTGKRRGPRGPTNTIRLFTVVE